MFAKLTAYLDSFNERFGVPGLECVIWQRHKSIYRHHAGFAESNKIRPIRSGNLYWVYSVTKVATATAAMQLIQTGRLGLDDPVADYLPAFSQLWIKTEHGVVPARTRLTIRHLLSMQGGFNYDLSAPAISTALDASGGTANTQTLVSALAKEPLDFEPGTHFQYSLCMDVLGAVLEVVSGVSLGRWMQENLFTPLEMKCTGFHLSKAGYQYLSNQYRWNPKTGKLVQVPPDNFCQLTAGYESGGGGLYSTADDLILLADALACGGIGARGCSILSQESVNQMRQNLLSPNSLVDYRRRYPRPGYSYGCGVRVCISSDNPEPMGTFGWDGAAGAHILIDPENELSMVYLQHVLDMEFLYDQVFPEMDRLVYVN